MSKNKSGCCGGIDGGRGRLKARRSVGRESGVRWTRLFFFNKCIYLLAYLFILFLASLGFHCCMQAFSSCGEQGLLFVVMCGLLTAVASLVAEHGF